MKSRFGVIFFLLTLAWVPAHAQRALQSPREFFGFEMGADRKLASWPEILQYYQQVAEQSDRVDLAHLGKTTLGKPFIALMVSAPENLQRLEHYKSVQTRLSDPRGLTSGEADRLIGEGKSIVMITCNIHSTEIASSQTAVEFIYRLATQSDPQTVSILKDTILILVPSLNPDGQQMVVEWYRKYVGTPHEACPLPELYHRYVGHDNNRDWYMFTQVETQHTISKLHNVWHPQIVYDVHEMGSSAARIFVPPWMDPVDPNIDPIVQQMTLVVGTSMAADLTSAGRKGVVMNAMYDLWTPSRHYQNYHGGIRILTESASVRIASPITVRFEELDAGRGYDARRPSWNFPEPWPGGQWRLGDIVTDQLIAFRSCLAAAARDKERLLRNFYRIGKKAVERKDPYAFVIPAEQKDPINTAKMLNILRFGMVEIHQAKAAFTANGKSYRAGAYIIPLAQPYGSWAKTLLERQDYPDLREYPGGPPRRPYDVTAHTLPFMMGVAADLVRDPFECSMVKTDRVSPPAGVVHGLPGPSGYLISHDTTQSSLALNRIFKRGFKVAWLSRPVELQGRSFTPGSIYVPQAAELDGFMSKLASETHLPLYVADRSLGGGPGFQLDPPRIGLYKSYVPSMDEGWTRWLLEQYEFPYRSLYDKDVREGSLRARFDAIVIPDQTTEAIVAGHRLSSANGGRMPDEYTGGIGEEGVRSIRDFIEQGGALITLNRAAEFAIDALQLPVRNALERASTRDFYCPGSLLQVEVDPASPLGFGMSPRASAWVEGGVAFETNEPSIRFPVRYVAKELLMSGWLLGANLIQGKPAVLEMPKGKGKVILLGFRPQYRGQSYGTFPLLFNALYYSAAKPLNGSAGR